MSYEEGCSASEGYEIDSSYGCDAYDSYYNPPDSPAVCESSYGYDNSSHSPSVWTTSHGHYNRYTTGSGDCYCGRYEKVKNIFVIFIGIVGFCILIGALIWYYTT